MPISGASLTRLTMRPSFPGHRSFAGWFKVGCKREYLRGGVRSHGNRDPARRGRLATTGNIALHGIETCSTNGRWLAGKRFICETLETFAAPPKGHRKCRPEHAVNSLRGPKTPERHHVGEPPRFTDRIRTEPGEPCDWSKTTRKQGPIQRPAKTGSSVIYG